MWFRQRIVEGCGPSAGLYCVMAVNRTPPRPSAATLEEHVGFIRALAQGLLLGADEVEDVVQETYLTALRSPPIDKGILRRWMAVVARRAGLKIHRSARRRKLREHAAARGQALGSAADAVAQLDAQRALVNAVESLAEPYRSTIIMRYFYGLTPTEIARTRDSPVKTIETRLRRALDLLRKKLDGGRNGGRGAWQAALVPLVDARSAVLSETAMGGAVAMTSGTKIGLLAVVMALLVAVVLGVSSLPEEPSTVSSNQIAEERAPMPELGTSSVEAGDKPHPAAVVPEGRVAVLGGRVAPARTLVAAPSQPPPPQPPGGSIVGKVGAGGGSPLPREIKIQLEGWLPEDDGIITLGSESELTREAAAGAGGGFGFYDLPHGIYTLVVTAPGYIPARKRTFLVTPERGVRATLVLSQGHVAIVRVADARGHPVAGHGVRLEPTGSRKRVVDPPTLHTNAEGVARWTMLEEGWYRVRPVGGGTWTSRALRVWKQASELSVECRIVLGTEIAGRVFGPEGKPLSGITLEFADDQKPNVMRQATTTSAGDGRYRVSGLPAGTYGVRLRTNGFAAFGGSIVVREGMAVGHDIRIGMTRIFGRITMEETGKPWPKAGVFAAHRGGTPAHVDVRPTRDGTWSIHGLPPGTYQVKVSPWLSGFEAVTRTVELTANGNVPVDVAIRSRAPGTLTLTFNGRKPGDVISLSRKSPAGIYSSLGRVDGDRVDLTLGRGPHTLIVRRSGRRVGEIEVQMPPRGTVHRTFDLEPAKR